MTNENPVTAAMNLLQEHTDTIANVISCDDLVKPEIKAAFTNIRTLMRIASERAASMSFDVLDVLRTANKKRHIEWTNGAELSLTYRGNELAGETGEACNVLKKIERERLGMVGSRATLEQAAEELADVVICADLAAMDLGVDLRAAVISKFNKTSHKNGLETRMEKSAGLSPEIVRLIIAARNVAYNMDFKGDEIRELDKAVEEFATAVAWEDEPTDEELESLA